MKQQKNKGTISEDEQIELDDVDTLLAVLEGHRKDYRGLISQSIQAISASLQSSSSSISKPTSQTATRRNSNRPRRPQAKFSKAVRKRDKVCVATGMKEEDGVLLVAARIVPLHRFTDMERQYEFSPLNGVLMLKEFENDYDSHKWYFNEDGSVVVLYKKWGWKKMFKKINLDAGPNAPSPNLIRLHNQIAMQDAPNYCPECWKCVGRYNVEAHQKSSCEGLNDVDEVEGGSDTSDFDSDSE